MPTVTIDGIRVEVPEGSTILDAAKRLGIDVPTMCHLDGFAPSTSCLACVVKVVGRPRMVPSCATAAVDGMEIESETPEVHHARRMAIELLLSDHLGDCVAPCEWACPTGMDIPQMLRQIRDGDLDGAIATIKRDIALPAVLGRVCGKPCEKGCRRTNADGAIAICSLKAQVADHDLAADAPYSPPRKPDSGKAVAVVGAGPCGLAAAFHLATAGHRVVLFDGRPRAGGRLRDEFDEATLPADVLDAEIAQVLRLAAEWKPETAITDRAEFDRLRDGHDAVLIACGVGAAEQAGSWGLAAGSRGIEVERGTFLTGTEGVFAAGGAARAKGPVVRDVADGKQAAAAIDAILTDSAAPPSRPFTVRAGRLPADEVALMIDTNVAPARGNSADGHEAKPGEPDPAWDQARHEAARCLHCDCRARHDCRLKRYAQQYDARPNQYEGTRRPLAIQRAASGLVYEPGKCIDCGLCIQVASRHRELLGLTFIGRGFDVRVGVPLNRSLDDALGKLAAECAAVCPTAALAMDTPPTASDLPLLPTRPKRR